VPQRYLDLTSEDLAHLATLGTLIEINLDRIIPEVAASLQDAEELDGMLPPGDLKEQLRPGLTAYLSALKNGSIEHYLGILTEGIRRRMADEMPYVGMVVAVMAFESAILRLLPEIQPVDSKRPPSEAPFVKFNHMCLMAAANAYLEAKEATIRAQQEAMLALSTPVVEVWRGILALPLVGTIDTGRAKQITQNLLRSIRQTQARIVILDITGVPLVDTRVANHLLKTIRAARLLGARGIIAGISPEVADTLITLDVDFEGISTYFSLRQALEASIDASGEPVIAPEVGR